MQRTASHFAGLEYGLRGLGRREPSRKVRLEKEAGAQSQKALCTILKSFVCVEQNDGGALKDFSRKVTRLSFQFEKITHCWVGMETADQTRRLLGQNSPLHLICECLSFCMLENLAYQCGDVREFEKKSNGTIKELGYQVRKESEMRIIQSKCREARGKFNNHISIAISLIYISVLVQIQNLLSTIWKSKRSCWFLFLYVFNNWGHKTYLAPKPNLY